MNQKYSNYGKVVSKEEFDKECGLATEKWKLS